MNKKIGWLFSFIFIGIFLINFVAAQYSGGYGFLDFRRGSQDVINAVVDFSEPFLQVILGGDNYTGWILFEKFLIFMLILSIVYLSLNKVPMFGEQRNILWIVTIIVSILAVRYLSVGWINTILLEYQVLGVALTGILPFIIYLFFLHNVSNSSIVRKIGWIFFIIVYYGLWSTSGTYNYGQIYLWTMVVSGLFLLFDGTIHKYYMTQGVMDARQSSYASKIAEIDGEINSINSSALPDKLKKKTLKKLEKDRMYWTKQLGRL